MTPAINFDGIDFRRRQQVRLVQLFACIMEIHAASEGMVCVGGGGGMDGVGGWVGVGVGGGGGGEF